MVKHTQLIPWLLPTSCLSVFDHFVRLLVKGLMWENYMIILVFITIIIMVVNEGVVLYIVM